MTSVQLPLWGPGPEEGPAAKPGRPESADQRRTRRQHEIVAQGGHPLTLALTRPLAVHPRAAEQDRRCGNCKFRELVGRPDHQRPHPRCIILKGPHARTFEDSPYPRLSWGTGTQIRKWWPGCADHEWGDPALSPDAARSGPADNDDE